jgi:hypothetical protein
MFICFGARGDNFTPEELLSIVNKIKNFPAKIESYLSQITREVWVIVILLYIIEFVITGYLVSMINNKLEQRANKKEQISKDKSFIEKILDPHLLFREKIDRQEHLNTPEDVQINKDISEVKEALKKAESSRLTKFIDPLELKLKELNNNLIVLKHKKELDYIRAQKYQEQREIEELEKKKRIIEWQIQDNKKMFLQKLDTYNNRVFKKENLSKKEFQALIEDGFKQVNEFCVLEKKRISVLVKPFGNHTISHEFLVWSAKRLLKKTEGIRKIEEHLTRDADLTFEFNRKEFALEIEKGELLRKHQQLKEKIDYLNENYPNRWMIIVSNRDFFTKYKKFGFTSTRKQLSENLPKLLKNAHTKIPIV